MNIDRLVLAFAGLVVLVSVFLAAYVDARWVWLTAFIGVNLFQAAFTGFCPLAKILKAIGKPAGPAFK